MTPWKPLIVFFLNFLVGWFVSQGLVDPNNHDFLVNTLAEVVGYGIILITSISSIVHVFKHPHTKVAPAAGVTQTVKTETETTAVFTDQPNPGTPPIGTPTLPQTEQ